MNSRCHTDLLKIAQFVLSFSTPTRRVTHRRQISPDMSACRLKYRIRRSAKSSSRKRRLSVSIRAYITAGDVQLGEDGRILRSQDIEYSCLTIWRYGFRRYPHWAHTQWRRRRWRRVRPARSAISAGAGDQLHRRQIRTHATTQPLYCAVYQRT